MSWKPEVIADSSGKWCGNALRFATKAEAEANARDLMMRWFLVRETRATESDDPVNIDLSPRGTAPALSRDQRNPRLWRNGVAPGFRRAPDPTPATDPRSE